MTVEQTLNGKPITFFFDNGFWVVYYMGEKHIMKQRPLTDQEMGLKN